MRIPVAGHNIDEKSCHWAIQRESTSADFLSADEQATTQRLSNQTLCKSRTLRLFFYGHPRRKETGARKSSIFAFAPLSNPNPVPMRARDVILNGPRQETIICTKRAMMVLLVSLLS